MHATIRPHVTTGAALFGASLIAVAPLSAPLPLVEVPAHVARSVELAASTDPITEWVQVLQTAFTNVSGLGTQLANDPTPILNQFLINTITGPNSYTNTLVNGIGTAISGLVTQLGNLPGNAQMFLGQLASGHISDAVATVWQTVLPFVLVPLVPLNAAIQVAQPVVKNFSNVFTAVTGLLFQVGIDFLEPVYATVQAFGDIGQAIYDGVTGADLPGALGAIINAPAVLVGALLNGYAGTPGLLSNVGSVNGTGTIAALLNARDTIAQAIGAPVPMTAQVAAAAAPLTATTSVTASAKHSLNTAGHTTLNRGAPTAGAVTNASEPKTTGGNPKSTPMLAGPPSQGSNHAPKHAQ